MIPNAWAGFDFGLGPDVEMLRKSVHDFAQDRIAPRAAAIDRDNTFPRDLWPEMGALGLHGITAEEQYGGSDIASAPTCSPEISLGRYFFFCSALPLRLSWLTHRLECAP